MGLFSCEKEETPVTLPPKTGAQFGRVTMGEEYGTQIFWDLEKNVQVKTSAINSWDLSFDAAPDGYTVRMNGGNNINLFNTGGTDFSAVKALPAGLRETMWGWDDPKEQTTGNYVGQWWNATAQQSAQNVFIVRIGDTKYAYYKIQFLAVDKAAYTFRVATLKDAVGKTIVLPKQAGFNRVYYSFADSADVSLQPDPPQENWDFVFTRYRYIYYDYPTAGLNFPYTVSGVILNPYKVQAAADSTLTFATADLPRAQAATFTNNADAIGGMGWKKYNFDQGRFIINPAFVCFIRSRSGKLYKLHFLDFYLNGVKGSPSFESERLQ